MQPVHQCRLAAGRVAHAHAKAIRHQGAGDVAPQAHGHAGAATDQRAQHGAQPARCGAAEHQHRHRRQGPGQPPQRRQGIAAQHGGQAAGQFVAARRAGRRRHDGQHAQEQRQQARGAWRRLKQRLHAGDAADVGRQLVRQAPQHLEAAQRAVAPAQLGGCGQRGGHGPGGGAADVLEAVVARQLQQRQRVDDAAGHAAGQHHVAEAVGRGAVVQQRWRLGARARVGRGRRRHGRGPRAPGGVSSTPAWPSARACSAGRAR